MGNTPPPIPQPTFSVFCFQAVLPSDFTEAKHFTVQQVQFTNTFDIYYSRQHYEEPLFAARCRKDAADNERAGTALLELMASSATASLH